MSKKALSSVVILLTICTLIFSSCTITPAVEPTEPTQEETTSPTLGEITFSIDCKTVADNMDLLDKSVKENSVIPEDYYLLKETTFSIESKEQTAFDILLKATKDNNIQIDYEDASVSAFGSAYIKGIGNLYEYNCGEKSGWLYMINGKSPTVGSDSYILQDGDVIEFRYSCSWGEDLV